MSRMFKSYENCFVLEQSKLNRLISVLREKYPDPPPREAYQVRHFDGTFQTVDSLDKVYGFYNSGKKQITELVIDLAPISSEGDSPDNRTARIEFAETPRSGKVSVTVSDPDHKWVEDAFAAIEEQVERCFKRGFMYSISANRGIPLLYIAVVAALLLLLVMAPRPLEKSMWLTNADIEEFSTQLEKSSTISQEQQLVILKRQLKNLRDSLQTPPFRFTWPALFVIIPILPAMTALIYLVGRCYPRSVFLWGDNEELYQVMMRRKDFVLKTFLASTAVSILAGLFLMGVDSYLR